MKEQQMDAHSSKRNLPGRSEARRIAYRALAIACAMTLALGLTGASSAQTSSRNALEDPSPYLRAFPVQDRVDGSNWPTSVTIALEITDPVEQETHVYENTDGTGSVNFLLSDYDGYDLRQGDVVTMTGGGASVTHTVGQLFVTGIDLDLQTVTGTAEGSSDVHVWAGEVNLEDPVPVIDGAWHAVFPPGPIGPALFPGVCGGAEAWGEGGSSTIVDWCMPWFRVSRDWDYVDAFDWPVRTVVTATVTHPDNLACGGSAVSSDALMATIQLEEGCTVASGDSVTVSGGGMTKDHVVTALDVTWFDVAGNRVGGTATPGLEVAIWVNGVDNSYMTTQPDGDGNWAVDFNGSGYNIVPGAEGRARQMDPDGDRTVVDWQLYGVNTTDDIDGGTCDEDHCNLREAINAANNHPGADTIAFDIPGNLPLTIQPADALPTITDPITIDGTTQSGWATDAPVVELNGTNAGNRVTGLSISAGNSTVKGLVINGYAGDGISLIQNGGNRIEGNFIGTDWQGTEAVGNAAGVWVGDHTTGNTIGGVTPGARNLISGNNGDGVSINEGTSGTVVQGNYIGTDRTGTKPLPNTSDGVVLVMGTTDNVIGGTEAGEGNVISANAGSGVDIADEGTSRNAIEGNFIGIDTTGGLPLGNGGAGINIRSGASHNTVGGSSEGARNIISANGGEGVLITDPGATENAVQGNYIGTDATGMSALGNSYRGIFIAGGPAANLIGGSELGAGNLISGNGLSGVNITDGDSNIVQGNYIGTDVTGTAALGNGLIGGGHGIVIDGGAGDNVIGGAEDGARNVICGNIGDGISINSAGTIHNIVLGNYIGTDVTGTAALGNNARGVGIGDQASGNFIGGAGAGEGNLISGNHSDGIGIFNPGTTGNAIQGNLIGTDASGVGAVPNEGAGIWMGDGASSNAVGGLEPGARNVVSGNDGGGISFGGIGTGANRVQGNLIGTDATGMVALGNGESPGVGIFSGASGNLIGGTEGAARNVISANRAAGINIGEVGTQQNTITGNYIGTTIDGLGSPPNAPSGIWIFGGASYNQIGGTVAGAGNLISGNEEGVVILGEEGAAPVGNVLEGNYIGTDLTGLAPLPNWYRGIVILDGAHDNLIGGSGEGAGNLISSNAEGGVGIAESPDNDVRGNEIYANTFAGVWIWGAGSTGNRLQGNVIGAEPNGTQPLGNGVGVWIGGGAAGNTIGGENPKAGNTIAFNTGPGVLASSDAGSGNAILANAIHHNADLGIDLAEDGVTPNDPRDRDSGPNDLQNFPVLSPPILFHGSLKVAGILWSKPNATYRIEFFSVTTCDETGYGEGDRYLGFKKVKTGPLGFAAFVFQLPRGFESKACVTATATDKAGSTSEFSHCSGPARHVGGGR